MRLPARPRPRSSIASPVRCAPPRAVRPTAKGVLRSHANYLYDVWACAMAARMSADDRMLCILPLFHINAQVVNTLGAMYVGDALILLEGFSPRSFLPALARYRATMFNAVPTLCYP